MAIINVVNYPGKLGGEILVQGGVKLAQLVLHFTLHTSHSAEECFVSQSVSEGVREATKITNQDRLKVNK